MALIWHVLRDTHRQAFGGSYEILVACCWGLLRFVFRSGVSCSTPGAFSSLGFRRGWDCNV